MDDALKRNLRKTGVFMLITACLPCFYLLGYCMNNADAYLLCFAIAYWGYLFSAFFVLGWGCFSIWKFPFGKALRALLTIAWLALYPILCLGWILLFALIVSSIMIR